MNLLTIKKGDAFLIRCALKKPGNLFGWKVACWVKSGGRVIARLSPTVFDPVAGRFDFPVTANQSATWPTGMLDVDVRYTNVDNSAATKTFRIHCMAPVTEFEEEVTP